MAFEDDYTRPIDKEFIAPLSGAFFVVLIDEGTPRERRLGFQSVTGLGQEIETEVVTEIGQPGLANATVKGNKTRPVVLRRGADTDGYLRRWWNDTLRFLQGHAVPFVRRRVEIYAVTDTQLRQGGMITTLYRAGISKYRTGKLDAMTTDVYVEEIHLVCDDLVVDFLPLEQY